MRNSHSCTIAILRLTASFALLIGLTGCADNSTKQNLTRGYQALDARQFDQALSIADQHLKSSANGPGAADAYYLKGRALEGKPVANDVQARSNYFAARQAYQQGLSLNPDSTLKGRLLAGSANASYWLDDYTAAAAAWKQAYDLSDDSTAKSFMLYRIGLCYQRQGDFAAADKTFALVEKDYPNTEAANRARGHTGYRHFTLQLATFNSSSTAETALINLRRDGAIPTRAVDARGNWVVTLGPIRNYQQALALKNRYAYSYPSAVIVP